MSATASRQYAVVTGGSSGIGYELAKQFLEHDFDVLIAADVGVDAGAQKLQEAVPGAHVEALEVDLSTYDGVEKLYSTVKQGGRKVDVLAANAGIGLGHAFLEQKREDWEKVVDTNIVGTLHLIQHIGKDMVAAGAGRILVTSSIASQMPGAFNAVYNASKAFLQSFSFALRNELKDSGVTVTALLPGPTETDFFDRAGLGKDTKVGTSKKDDPADVAKAGYEALMDGEGDVVYGLKNKMQAAAAKFIPDDRLAEMHRNMAEPGTAKAS